MQPDGSIDTTGNTRTGEDGPPLEGDFAKGWNLDRNAITLAQYAVAFDRWDELSHRSSRRCSFAVKSTIILPTLSRRLVEQGANGQTALD